MRLRDVRDIQLQSILNEQRGMSFSHVTKLRMVMQELFHQAYRSRLIPFDPSDGLRLPRLRQKRDPCLQGSGKWNKHHQDTKNHCGNPGYSDEKRIAASIVARTWRTIFVALSYTKRHHPRAERYLEVMELFRQRIRPTHGGARRRGTNLTTRHCTRFNNLLSPAYLLHRFATSGSGY